MASTCDLIEIRCKYSIRGKCCMYSYFSSIYSFLRKQLCFIAKPLRKIISTLNPLILDGSNSVTISIYYFGKIQRTKYKLQNSDSFIHNLNLRLTYRNNRRLFKQPNRVAPLCRRLLHMYCT
jgi:hypothetical protein